MYIFYENQIFLKIFHHKNKVLSISSQYLYLKYNACGTSLVDQWLRIRPPMQGPWVQSLVQEDPTCHGAVACAPQLLSLRSRAREPQLLSPRATTTEGRVPTAHALQQEKPLQ